LDKTGLSARIGPQFLVHFPQARVCRVQQAGLIQKLFGVSSPASLAVQIGQQEVGLEMLWIVAQRFPKSCDSLAGLAGSSEGNPSIEEGLAEIRLQFGGLQERLGGFVEPLLLKEDQPKLEETLSGPGFQLEVAAQ
jgi:hypothetical protein